MICDKSFVRVECFFGGEKIVLASWLLGEDWNVIMP